MTDHLATVRRAQDRKRATATAYRHAIIDAYIQGERASDIARAAGISREAVYSLLRGAGISKVER